MDFRVVNEKTLPKVMNLWDYCFEKKDTPFFQWYFNEYCLKQNIILGCFDEANDNLMNMLHLNPYTIKLRGKELKIPYIVGVATAPQYRGRHLFGPLLDTAFAILRAQNQAFVLLMPINAGIYRPYEFDYCYYRHLYEMPLTALPKSFSDEELILECVNLDQIEIFEHVYNNVTIKYHATVKRSFKNWQNLLAVHQGEHIKAVLVKRNTEILGYMFYSITGKIFTIQEMLVSETAARNALLHFASKHVSEAEEISWLAEAEDKTYLHLTNQRYSGRLQPFMMARCINIRQALLQLNVSDLDLQDSLVLLIHDKTLPINNGLLRLKVESGKTDIISTVDMQEIEMDVAAFTQLYFGQFSVQELAAENRLKVHKQEAAELLDKLFPKCHNYINEYF